MQVQCEMRDHPLFAMPRIERQKLLERALKVPRAPETGGGPRRLDRRWRLCHKCRRIYNALLAASNGDWLRVLRHVQVRRFYLSRRYLVGAVTVEPHLSVDAAYHQVSADRSQANLPAALQNLVLFRAARPAGERQPRHHGVRRSPQAAAGGVQVPARLQRDRRGADGALRAQLDEVLVASSNEKHLAAFKELPDFASFKGRIELVRVRTSAGGSRRRRSTTRRSPPAVGKHVAPATEVAAQWAVLTRLKSRSGTLPADVQEVLEELTPLEDVALRGRDRPRPPQPRQARELKKWLPALYQESDSYPNYEGAHRRLAREIKTALFNAAQNPDRPA